MRTPLPLMALLVAVALGCESTPEATDGGASSAPAVTTRETTTETPPAPEPVAAAAPAVPQRLPLDPTDDISPTGWWTNGDELLRIGPGANYTLYPGTNRYHSPRQRGLWRRQTYSMYRFIPYRTAEKEPEIVHLQRDEGVLVLTVPNLEPMYLIDRPPVVAEDRLIGRWEGDAGRIQLSSHLRYTFRPPADPTGGPVSLGEQSGAWRLDEGVLRLRPDSPRLTMPPMNMVEQDGSILLQTAASTFHRAESGG